MKTEIDRTESEKAALLESLFVEWVNENAARIKSLVATSEMKKAERAELLDALQDCAGVLDSINRHVAGTSIAVIAVLEKAQSAIKNAAC